MANAEAVHRFRAAPAGDSILRLDPDASQLGHQIIWHSFSKADPTPLTVVFPDDAVRNSPVPNCADAVGKLVRRRIPKVPLGVTPIGLRPVGR